MIFIQEAGSLKVLRQRAIHVLRAGVKAWLLFGFATTVHPQIPVTGVNGGNPSVPLAQQTDQQIGTLLQHWPSLMRFNDETCSRKYVSACIWQKKRKPT